MIVVKKINNNVAICRDGSQRELVAFGKGSGFPPTPYELTDLSRIDRTFYNVNSKYIPLLADIPPEIVRFTADQILAFQDELPYETSSNLVLTLADHIFARFATHVQYLLKRVFEQKHIDSENLRMYQSMREEYPEISACVDRIARCLKDGWSVGLAEEEKLYLILHVNRVCSKENGDN